MFPLAIAMDQNSDLRVRFLLKEITEEFWTKELKKRQKKAEKDRAVRQILDMMVNTMSDTFHMYMNDPAEHDIEMELNQLREYVNPPNVGYQPPIQEQDNGLLDSWKH